MHVMTGSLPPRFKPKLRYVILRAIAIASILLTALALILYGVWRALPTMQTEEIATLQEIPPRSFSTLLAQRQILLAYAKTNPVLVSLSVFLVYVIMQTFAIPGTLSLSVMAGALYGTVRGLLFVSVVCTVGATSCFLLSYTIGTGLAQTIWPSKIEAFGKEVDKRRADMLSYIIFLRVTPILPNTFINVVSPVVRVPILPFTIGTFFGCMPNNLIAVNAGNRLTELKTLGDLYDVRSVFLGLIIGAVALGSVYIRGRLTPKEHVQ